MCEMCSLDRLLHERCLKWKFSLSLRLVARLVLASVSSYAEWLSETVTLNTDVTRDTLGVKITTSSYK